MEVFKFGGASIQNIERIENVVKIVEKAAHRPLLIVASALGKTTNGLEKVAEAFFSGHTEESLSLFEQIKNQHLNLAKYLLVKQHHPFMAQFADICTEAEWMLYDKPVREYDYYYDQIVCLGELFSTVLLVNVFLEKGISAGWIDIRDVLRTDDCFREASLNFEQTKENTRNLLKPMFKTHDIVITQGFIGSTDENESTTLGREGSDYTAAIFARQLEADKVTIWKDVDAVLNADPKLFPEATPIPHLSYHEVIEMGYYGAQVIHPKTMKPLYNTGIPLQVKSFLDPTLPGTLIDKKQPAHLPSMLVRKDNQVMISFTTKDYSFAGETPIGQWYQMMEALHIRPNLIQNGAVELLAVFDDRADKISQLALNAESMFHVQVRRNLTLFTIRHYTSESISKYIGERKPLLQQQTPETVQCVFDGY